MNHMCRPPGYQEKLSISKPMFEGVPEMHKQGKSEQLQVYERREGHGTKAKHRRLRNEKKTVKQLKEQILVITIIIV